MPGKFPIQNCNCGPLSFLGIPETRPNLRGKKPEISDRVAKNSGNSTLLIITVLKFKKLPENKIYLVIG